MDTGQTDNFPISPDHRGRTLEIPGNSDPNIIPDGDHSSFVRVTGGRALQSLPSSHPQMHVKPVWGYDPLTLGPRPALYPPPPLSPVASSPLDTLGSGGALSAGGVASLLRLPRGCGEQTMIFLAPTLAASRYLDKTEQWSRLPPETKDHAVDLVQKGPGAGRAGVGQAIKGDEHPRRLVGGRGYPTGMGSMAPGTNSSCRSSPRVHADPAVPESGRLLWGVATSGQQHLVSLGACSGPLRAGGLRGADQVQREGD